MLLMIMNLYFANTVTALRWLSYFLLFAAFVGSCGAFYFLFIDMKVMQVWVYGRYVHVDAEFSGFEISKYPRCVVFAAKNKNFHLRVIQNDCNADGFYCIFVFCFSLKSFHSSRKRDSNLRRFSPLLT